MKMKIKNNHIV